MGFKQGFYGTKKIFNDILNVFYLFFCFIFFNCFLISILFQSKVIQNQLQNIEIQNIGMLSPLPKLYQSFERKEKFFFSGKLKIYLI